MTTPTERDRERARELYEDLVWMIDGGSLPTEEVERIARALAATRAAERERLFVAFRELDRYETGTNDYGVPRMERERGFGDWVSWHAVFNILNPENEP